MKNEMMRDRSGREHNSSQMHGEKPSIGSTDHKYPVALNDGRTVVFISDKSKEDEIRLKYESLKDKKYPTRNPRHHH